MIILIILIIVLLLSLSLINKAIKKKDNILEDVKLQENTIRNDGFALMLQQSDGTYEKSESSIWPTGMKFNSELSGCIDTDGNKIENSLSFDGTTNLVTLKTNKTSYCYVYFDKRSFTEYLIENVSSEELWNSPLEDDGYRYVGTDPNNYICFGTSDKDTCINDTDKYMYRIIGIFNDENGVQHTKLIKKEALNTRYVWHSNASLNTDWNNSDLYTGINGSYFLTNTDYSYMQNADWTDKIAIWNYTMTNTKAYESSGLFYTAAATAQEIYLHELNKNNKTSNIGEWKILSAKISLMYVSDYMLSLGSSALNYTSNSNYGYLGRGWMHLSNNDTNAPVNYEWTMTCFGKYGAWFDAIYVSGGGSLVHTLVNNDYVVRPVFYLESNVGFSSGTGTSSDPYIINLLTDSFE